MEHRQTGVGNIKQPVIESRHMDADELMPTPKA